MHNLQAESLSTHSMECALLVHFLCNIGNVYFNQKFDAEKLAVYALYHDAPEILTGDLPTPIKRYSQEMTIIYKKIEEKAAQKVLSFLPPELAQVYEKYFTCCELTQDETRVLKIADRLCAYIKCMNELNAGNTEFAQAHSTIEAELYANDSAELQFFLKHFADTFLLSLHEMGAEF